MNKNPKEIMEDLRSKFNDNFEEWNKLKDLKLEKSFASLYCINAVGEILQERKLSNHHEICCKIFDEIFADGVSSIYLASNAMIKPANIVLRRILELGLASIYLWDMPHMAHSWNHHDENLSFTNMLNHINSKGYISYVKSEHGNEISDELAPVKTCQRIYGLLSDIVHGKIKTFESNLPDRFVFKDDKWLEFIKLFEEVIIMLLNMFIIRFDIKEEIYKKVPLAKKEISENVS